jgi:hypothetical protein
MIHRLNIHNEFDVFIFLSECFDRYEEMFITRNKQRLFLRNNRPLIREMLKKQEIYAIGEGSLQGIFLIFREKNFRPYVHFLTKDRKTMVDLLKYFLWNFASSEIYCKLKKRNPILILLRQKAFMQIGDRGNECLLIKRALKPISPFVAKDTYLDYDELYYKRIK